MPNEANDAVILGAALKSLLYPPSDALTPEQDEASSEWILSPMLQHLVRWRRKHSTSDRNSDAGTISDLIPESHVFSKTTLPDVCIDVLKFIAQTGEIAHPWHVVKFILIWRLEELMSATWPQHCPQECIWQLRYAVVRTWNLELAPFTMQRASELLIPQDTPQYASKPKFAIAIARVLRWGTFPMRRQESVRLQEVFTSELDQEGFLQKLNVLRPQNGNSLFKSETSDAAKTSSPDPQVAAIPPQGPRNTATQQSNLVAAFLEDIEFDNDSIRDHTNFPDKPLLKSMNNPRSGREGVSEFVHTLLNMDLER